MEHKSMAIYRDGKFAGVDNESACDLLDRAVEFGVKTWGKKEVMAIQIGAHWLEGWMECAELPEEERAVLRNSIQHYFFI